MKNAIALMLLMSLLCLGAGRAGCQAEVKPVDVGGGPGIAVVISEEDKAKFDDGISKLEGAVTKLVDVLPVIASLAKVAGEVSGNEDVVEAADDVADAAEKGAAGLGVLLAIAGLIKNIVKKEDG